MSGWRTDLDTLLGSLDGHWVAHDHWLSGLIADSLARKGCVGLVHGGPVNIDHNLDMRDFDIDDAGRGVQGPLGGDEVQKVGIQHKASRPSGLTLQKGLHWLARVVPRLMGVPPLQP